MERRDKREERRGETEGGGGIGERGTEAQRGLEREEAALTFTATKGGRGRREESP